MDIVKLNCWGSNIKVKRFLILSFREIGITMQNQKMAKVKLFEIIHHFQQLCFVKNSLLILGPALAMRNHQFT